LQISFTPTGANILHAAQHQDNEAGMFFKRAEWSLDGFDVNEEAFQEQFGALAREFHAALEAGLSVQRPRIAIFVSAISTACLTCCTSTRSATDLERIRAVRAVRWHLNHRILFYGNKGFD
jgi:formyltetrahydrofolate hydrolase